MKKLFGQHCTLSSALSTHLACGLCQRRRFGSLPLLWHTFPCHRRGHKASASFSLKGGDELNSMCLGHHPDPAGHWHHQPAHHWQPWVKPSATQTPAVSDPPAEIMLSSSFSCSYVLLSTPQAIPFCSTHPYTHAHFSLHAPVTSFPCQRGWVLFWGFAWGGGGEGGLVGWGFFCKSLRTT